MNENVVVFFYFFGATKQEQANKHTYTGWVCKRRQKKLNDDRVTTSSYHWRICALIIFLHLLVVSRERRRRLLLLLAANLNRPLVARLSRRRRRRVGLLLIDADGRTVRLGRPGLWLGAAHVGVRAVVLARFAAVHRVPVVAMEDALIEHCAGSAQEGILASVVAEVIGLAAGLLVGVHSVFVGDPVAGEASLWHPGVVWEISARLAAHGAWWIMG